MKGGLRLGVVDQSPVANGRTAADAVRETLELARLCDRLGYSRYWLAEHHSTNSFAGSAPEVLIPRVAMETERIRVGSGGVMLPHYSPYRVAEQFRMLQTLFPGRIDLGVAVVCAEDRDEAERLALSMHLWRMRILRGVDRGIPSPEQAESEFASLGVPLEELREDPRGLVGPPGEVAEGLRALADHHGVDEVLVVTVVHDFQARKRSHELLARELLDG